MFPKAIGNKRLLSAALALLACLAFTTLYFYESSYFLDPPDRPTSSTASGSINIRQTRKVLLPCGFRFQKNALREHLAATSGDGWDTLQLGESEQMATPPHEPGRFKYGNSLLFGSSRDPECFLKEKIVRFGVDELRPIPLNLGATFAIFLEEAKSYGDTYNKYLLPYLEKYMDEDNSANWFRSAGSSVWLKDYNVHFVVSRVLVTENGDRRSPYVSLVLAQIFDEFWNEVEDVRVVFPTNKVAKSPAFTVGYTDFHSLRFPRFLPIPFQIEETGKFWGPEDPRVILVKNKHGHQEPVVVFNAYHTQKAVVDDKVENQAFRSIFMSFPFQLQKGEQIAGVLSGTTQNHWYARTKQLTAKGEPGRKVEKNWVPFVSHAGERHEHVMFATMLDPLRIVKCELWTDNGECSVEEVTSDTSVGAFRGGTPLVRVGSVNEENTEFFVGVARAHLKDCGCGHDFYRPNLVVVARIGSRWRVTHATSTIDLGTAVVPWNAGEKVCHNVNSVIPNGIEFWDLERDLMSLGVSVIDQTVERVHLHGVLGELQKARFWELDGDGDSGSPVKCALYSSKEYCMRYGIEQAKKTEMKRTFGGR